MKTLVCFICLCVGLAVAARQIVFATPQNDYKTYANARFKYSISYPADLLIPQGEAENGDGQVFREKSSSVEMRVYGGYNVSTEDWLDEQGVADVSGGRVVRLPFPVLLHGSEVARRLNLMDMGAGRALYFS